MALNLASKSPTGVIRYSWSPPVLGNDSVSSATLIVTAGTVVIDSYGLNDEGVFFYASGGALGETSIITASAETADGETLTETLYLPIRPSTNAFSATVADILTFALRPVIGLSATATADELEDARENFDDLLAFWAGQGADLQVKLPTVTGDTLYVPDYAINALKTGLRVRLCGLYSKPVDIEDFKSAQRGLQQIKMTLLPTIRENEYF